MSNYWLPITNALYGTLSGDATLVAMLAGSTSIYPMQAEEGANFDYIVYNFQSGVSETDTPIDAENDLIFVRAYSNINPAKAGSIMERVDALLHKKTLTVAGWTNIWTARELQLENVETDQAGVQIWMRGAFYRFRLSK